MDTEPAATDPPGERQWRSLLDDSSRSASADCRRCSQQALPGTALCADCYAEITDDLCTAQVLELLVGSAAPDR
jgi:uncharacterized OB-fold protein